MIPTRLPKFIWGDSVPSRVVLSHNQDVGVRASTDIPYPDRCRGLDCLPPDEEDTRLLGFPEQRSRECLGPDAPGTRAWRSYIRTYSSPWRMAYRMACGSVCVRRRNTHCRASGSPRTRNGMTLTSRPTPAVPSALSGMANQAGHRGAVIELVGKFLETVSRWIIVGVHEVPNRAGRRCSRCRRRPCR